MSLQGRKNVVLFALTHQLKDVARVVGLRDRLRCPSCAAVGTYKPYGGWLDSSRESGRRYLCKWCGYYRGRPMNQGPVVVREAFIDEALKCWRIIDFYNGAIPAGAYTPRSLMGDRQTNPWGG